MLSRSRYAGAWLLKALLGRRHVVRLARFLSMEARLDLNGGVDEHGEPLIRAAVAEQANTEGTLHILDVGAHLGEWTEAMLRACAAAGRTDAVFHLFEPGQKTFQQLEAKWQSHPSSEQIQLNRRALSSRRGHAELRIAEDLAGSNSLHELPHGAAPIRTEAIEIDTIDSYASAAGLDRIAMVKIDAEGHDFEVLQGASGCLAEHRIDVVQFEYNSRWIFARRFLRDAFELLQPLGYRLGKVTREGVELYGDWHPELETFREVNFIACLPAWAERFPTIPWWND
ncbi:MAG: FkbM family methyltransferase [Acidobacteriota bacterium]